MESLTAHSKIWFLVASAKDLPAGARRPVRVAGKRLVVFRAETGEVSALDDRCPHRGVSLSGGQVTGNTLVCPYHGLRFDGQGECKKMPCSVTPGEESSYKKIRAYAAIEADASIWVNLSDSPQPFCSAWPQLDASYRHFEQVNLVRARVPEILENFVDCGHTGFVHAGLFRGEPNREVDVTVRRQNWDVWIETLGEKDTSGIMMKMLNPDKEPMVHVDRFLPPFAIRVDYRAGNYHMVSTSICLPHEEFLTTIFTRIYLNAGVVTLPYLKIVEHMTHKILQQDKVILEDQASNLKEDPTFKSQFLKTDRPVTTVLKAYKDFLESKDGPSDVLTHAFRMKI